jgi:hypothetical protein
MESGHHGQVLPVEKEHFLNGIQVALGVAAKVSHLKVGQSGLRPDSCRQPKTGKAVQPRQPVA